MTTITYKEVATEIPLTDVIDATDEIPDVENDIEYLPEIPEALSQSPENIAVTLEHIDASVVSISDQLHHMYERLDRHVLSDKSKDEAFERLYSELEGYKKNSAFESVRPLFIDLILLFDRIAILTEEAGKNADKNCSDILGTISEELLEILYRRDIEVVISDSETFSPTTQRAIGVERTEIEAENNQIARIVRKGFRCGERLVRPEEIIVKKYSVPRSADQETDK